MTAAERADHDQVEQTTGKPGAATDSSDDESNSFGVDQQDRQQILLDDLRVEIARLADAVETQNELLRNSATTGRRFDDRP